MTQPKRKIRYAVVGAGNIAQVAVLPAFEHAAENSELVALVSSDAEKREALSERYKLKHTGGYDELEDVLQRASVDAVYIAVPNGMHREITERAARKHVHVLCEKPMAETVEDCEAMIRVCEENDVRLMIAYRLHFEEANLRAIELAQSGKLGELRIFSSVFSQEVRPGDVRTQGELAGGALYDMGVYPINAARYLFRDEPDEVFATCITGGDGRFVNVDETTTALLRFPGGRIAQLTASLSAAPVSSYRVIGSRGDLRVEPAYDYQKELTHHLTIGGETSEQSFAKRDQFAPELIAFSKCVLDGSEPESSGYEGLADVRIIRAIFRSAETGKTVRLTPYERTRRPHIGQAIHKPPVGEVEPVHAPSPTLD
ncbi:MAG TPA: Gfo/Idh/MocA family oxidoreductase [Polyangiales bacterium]|nr:Gfo/Idh/MocA family oxidoreductase [Polyangiales bacterium]